MPINGYSYGGYPAAGGYYAPPMPDNLAQLRAGQYQQPMQGQSMMQQQPMQTQPQQMPQTMPAVASAPVQPASNGILWVQGEEGAKAWLVAPGTTVMLMDSDGSSFYLKSADASGMPQPLRIFDYVERTPKAPVTPAAPAEAPQIPSVEYVTREDFEALAKRYEALSTRAEELADELAALKAKEAKPKKVTVKEDAE